MGAGTGNRKQLRRSMADNGAQPQDAAADKVASNRLARQTREKHGSQTQQRKRKGWVARKAARERKGNHSENGRRASTRNQQGTAKERRYGDSKGREKGRERTSGETKETAGKSSTARRAEEARATQRNSRRGIRKGDAGGRSREVKQSRVGHSRSKQESSGWVDETGRDTKVMSSMAGKGGGGRAA